MNVLTRWELCYSECVPTVELRLWPRNKKLGKARLMLWKMPFNGGSKMQLLAQLANSALRSDIDPWLSIARKYCFMRADDLRLS